MLLKPGDRLVMIGDSITEWGRPNPDSPSYDTALGHGYVARVAARLREVVPPPGVDVLNRGVGGHTVRDLAARWDRDALGLHPQALTVMIGINDVWRHFDPVNRKDAVPPDEYERTLGSLLGRARSRVRTLVALTPFYVQPHRADPMRRRMDEYGAIVARLATQHDAVLVDTQAVMDRLVGDGAPQTVAFDLVHVGDEGHRALAAAALSALGAGG